MNSRERRKLEAQQHNDAIIYEKWLKENTSDQPRRFQRSARASGKNKVSKALLSAAMLLGMVYR